MSIFMIVKGTPAEAVSAAIARGFRGAVVTKSGGPDTIIRALGSEDQAIRWFCEDAGQGPPYKPGSLLYYK